MRIFDMQSRSVTPTIDLAGQFNVMHGAFVNGVFYVVAETQQSSKSRLLVYRLSDNTKRNDIQFELQLYTKITKGISSDGWLIYGQAADPDNLIAGTRLYHSLIEGGQPSPLLNDAERFKEAVVHKDKVLALLLNGSAVLIKSDGTDRKEIATLSSKYG